MATSKSTIRAVKFYRSRFQHLCLDTSQQRKTRKISKVKISYHWHCTDHFFDNGAILKTSKTSCWLNSLLSTWVLPSERVLQTRGQEHLHRRKWNESCPYFRQIHQLWKASARSNTGCFSVPKSLVLWASDLRTAACSKLCTDATGAFCSQLCPASENRCRCRRFGAAATKHSQIRTRQRMGILASTRVRHCKRDTCKIVFYYWNATTIALIPTVSCISPPHNHVKICFSWMTFNASSCACKLYLLCE